MSSKEEDSDIDDFEIADDHNNDDDDLSDNDIASLQNKLRMSDMNEELDSESTNNNNNNNNINNNIEEETKKENISMLSPKKSNDKQEENNSDSRTTPREALSPRSQAIVISPRKVEAESSLKLHSKRKTLQQQSRNKVEHIDINLDSLSAIAMADIKRFSLSSTSILEVEVISAKDLYPPTKKGISPFCLLAIRKDSQKDHEKKVEIKKAHDATTVKEKTTSPVWNEKFEIKLDQVKGESKRWLVIEIRDKSPKGDCLGFVELNLNNYADMVPREEWLSLRPRKKEKVTGEVLIKTRIVPERKVEETVIIRNENFPTIPSFVYSSYWNAHCVKQVSFTHCNITSVPEGFYSLSSLTVLILHHNCLTTLPATLGRIYSLKVLDVSYNKLTTLPSELANLKNLQQFNIEENKFSESEVPFCIYALDLVCEIKGLLPQWEHIMEEEIAKREKNKEVSSANDAFLDEKEKEIQRLLSGISK